MISVDETVSPASSGEKSPSDGFDAVPVWAVKELVRIAHETLDPGEQICGVEVSEEKCRDLSDRAFRFRLSYEWFYEPGDGPYVDEVDIIVYQSRRRRWEVHTL
ncbi:hypothetical protein AB0D08_11570 [Kitasatospora sp. NPDC048540]|uniref:hypothetical protein n=1 Tax=unclassified Kitasatospora TaxID=2633591 RepID=UPI00053A93CB|nr:hypothetical protein [Kitasatospora sp. MBT63]